LFFGVWSFGAGKNSYVVCQYQRYGQTTSPLRARVQRTLMVTITHAGSGCQEGLWRNSA
jgi:hypothetical protein